MSQAQLAKRMKTKQPAIARLESGRSNTELETLVSAARALGAVVRVEITPEELVFREPLTQRWWEKELVVNPFGNDPPRASIQLTVTNFNNVLVLTGASSGHSESGTDWSVQEQLREITVPEATLKALASGTCESPHVFGKGPR